MVSAPALARRARATLRADWAAPSRWPVLDAARGVAVLAVVAWHLFEFVGVSSVRRADGTVPWLVWPIGLGRLGVDVFFVLSGFLVVRSWNALRAGAGGSWRAAGRFAIRRAQRILPGYWLSLVVLVPLVAPELLHQPRRLALFASVNAYRWIWLPGRVNVVYWSLTVEWHFYVLVPLLAWLMRRAGRWLVLAAALSVSIAWAMQAAHPFDLPASFIAGRIDQFAAGAVAAELVALHELGVALRSVRVLRSSFAGWGLGAAVLALGSVQGAQIGAASGPRFDTVLLHPLFGLVTAALLVRLLTASRRDAFAPSWLRFAGLVSFGVYLWHYPVLGLVFHIARVDDIAAAPFAVTVAGLIGLTATLVIACASYLLVERPLLAARSRTAPRAPAPLGSSTTKRLPALGAVSTATCR